MDLCLDSDTYAPHMDNNGLYVDHVPPAAQFIAGIRCPCGTRRNHPFYQRASLKAHQNTAAHQKWLDSINLNRHNYHVENEQLRQRVKSQQLIITSLTNTIEQLNEKVKNGVVGPASLLPATASAEEDLLMFD